jgi:hypothetical protein
MSLRIPFAVGSFAVSAVLTAIGSFSGSDDHQWRQWLIVLAISAVAAAVLFGFIVPRIRNVARGAVVLAVVGAVAIVVFWLGIPVLFAGAVALLVLEGRRRGVSSIALPVAAVLAALTTIAAVVLAFVG